MVFDMNTGSRYIDPENCALVFGLALTGATGAQSPTNHRTFSSNAGAIACIEEIRIHAKSGVELDRIQECNQYVFTRSQLRENSDYFTKYASMWGGGLINATTANRPLLGQLGATSQTYAIPMGLISGLFNPTVKGMKMPPGLLSGARIEIVLEEFGRVIGPAEGTMTVNGYAVTDPYIHCLSHELSDNSQAVLNEESVENGLEYTYTRCFSTMEASDSTSLNIQVKKAVSQGLRAFTIPIIQTNSVDEDEDSFSGALTYTSFNYRIGSSFYPQQKADSAVESYYITQNLYNKHAVSGWYSSALDFDTYAAVQGVIGGDFESDQRLNLSGTPINNSNTLSLNATVPAPGALVNYYVFLEYVAVSRSYLTNVEVKL